MKLCPQCDFIYEDDQSLCDMDGRELVPSQSEVTLDGKPSPQLWEDASAETASMELAPPAVSEALAQLAMAEWKSESGSEWKRFALIAAVGMLLGVLVFLVYYSSSRTANSKPEIQNTQLGATSPASSAAETPAANDVPTQITSSSEVLAADVSEVTSAAVSASPSRSGITRASTVASQSTARRVTGKKTKLESASVAQNAGVAKRDNVVARNQSKSVKPEAANIKKESGVSAFLKKTGRILKKPFKF